jgi:hypothetical protein
MADYQARLRELADFLSRLALIARPIAPTEPDSPLSTEACAAAYLRSQHDDAARFARQPQREFLVRPSRPGEFEHAARLQALPVPEPLHALVFMCCRSRGPLRISRSYLPTTRPQWSACQAAVAAFEDREEESNMIVDFIFDLQGNPEVLHDEFCLETEIHTNHPGTPALQ